METLSGRFYIPPTAVEYGHFEQKGRRQVEVWNKGFCLSVGKVGDSQGQLNKDVFILLSAKGIRNYSTAF